MAGLNHLRAQTSVAVLTLALTMVGISFASAQLSTNPKTIIYFVRHGETASHHGVRTLNAAGRERSEALAALMKEVAVTHLFASHTMRTREMLEPLAIEKGLTIVQLPKPGTMLDGHLVTESTATGAAAGPLLEALRRLPAGSRAVVAVNRENAFAVMSGLGVQVVGTCRPNQNCVSCASASCFPGNRDGDGDYDHLWTLSIDPSSGALPQLSERQYGRHE